MKRVIIAISAVLLIGVIFAGCVQNSGDKPDSFKGIRWVAPDYSMKFVPQEECKGTLTFDSTKYNVQFVFAPNTVEVLDTDKNNTQLFFADWKYEDDGSRLYIYNIMYNTEKYKEFKDDYVEFIKMNQEKIQ